VVQVFDSRLDIGLVFVASHRNSPKWFLSLSSSLFLRERNLKWKIYMPFKKSIRDYSNCICCFKQS